MRPRIAGWRQYFGLALPFFAFEWLTRLVHAIRGGSADWPMPSPAAAWWMPVGRHRGADRHWLRRRCRRSAWLLGVFWLLKLVPGIPGLRRLRRVLALETGPLLSVLVLFALVLFRPR